MCHGIQDSVPMSTAVMQEGLPASYACNATNMSMSMLPKRLLLTDQLQVLAGDRSLLEEAINDVDCEEKCIWQQLELLVDLHKPVNQNRPHLCIDVRLLQAESIINVMQGQKAVQLLTINNQL